MSTGSHRDATPTRLPIALAGALAALLLAVAPARAQIVSADVGVLHSPALTDPVVEVYAATAPVAFFRPYLISSWTIGELKPVLITQLAVPTFSKGPVWNSVDVGATWFPFNDYRPVPSVSTYLGARLPVPNTHLFSLFAVQPFQQEWSVIAGIAYTLHYRK